MPNPIQADRPTLRAMFERLDRDRSGAIDEDAVAEYLGELGLGGGLFGGQKVAAAVDKFMEKLDADGDRKVTWSEFVGGGRHLLPDSLRDANGKLDGGRVDGFFDAVVGRGNNRATKRELEPYLEREISAKAKSPLVAMMAGTIASAAAKVALDALDADKDKAFTREDVHALIDDINRETARV